MPVIPVIPNCNIYGINSKKAVTHSRVHGLCENIPPIQVLIPLSAAPARADGAQTQKSPAEIFPAGLFCVALGSVNTIEFLFACKEDKPALRECTLLVLDRKSR